jgi:hypothetical protein
MADQSAKSILNFRGKFSVTLVDLELGLIGRRQRYNSRMSKEAHMGCDIMISRVIGNIKQSQIYHIANSEF